MGLPKFYRKHKFSDKNTNSIRVKSIKSVFHNSKRISLPKFSENINLAIKTQALSVSNPLNPCSITQNVWVYLSFTENINLAIETQILSVSNPLNPCSITQNVWVYLSFTENINLAIET
jgi:hypothetical protein